MHDYREHVTLDALRIMTACAEKLLDARREKNGFNVALFSERLDARMHECGLARLVLEDGTTFERVLRRCRARPGKEPEGCALLGGDEPERERVKRALLDGTLPLEGGRGLRRRVEDRSPGRIVWYY